MEDNHDFNPALVVDGTIIVPQRQSEVTTHDFKNERELSDYIVSDIRLFVRSVFDDILVSYEVEKRLGKTVFGAGTKPRIDLFITGRQRTYIVELKKCRDLQDNRKAIGQLLNYGRELRQLHPTLVLITTQIDQDTAATIAYYELPIHYIFLSKSKTMEFRWGRNVKPENAL